VAAARSTDSRFTTERLMRIARNSDQMIANRPRPPARLKRSRMRSPASRACVMATSYPSERKS
jgi:hypothetical protein